MRHLKLRHLIFVFLPVWFKTMILDDTVWLLKE